MLGINGKLACSSLFTVIDMAKFTVGFTRKENKENELVYMKLYDIERSVVEVYDLTTKFKRLISFGNPNAFIDKVAVSSILRAMGVAFSSNAYIKIRIIDQWERDRIVFILVAHTIALPPWKHNIVEDAWLPDFGKALMDANIVTYDHKGKMLASQNVLGCFDNVDFTGWEHVPKIFWIHLFEQDVDFDGELYTPYNIII